MWKLLYALASPKRFYCLSTKWVHLLKWLTALLFVVGFSWGLYFAPPDYQQGDAFRIMYIHVPSAFLAMMIYSFMAFCSVLLLVWRIKLAGIALKVASPIGASMTLIALITGAIWGKPMWGTWWIWDARLTSMLILFFIYLGIIALGSAITHPYKTFQASAIFTLIGFVDLPIIHYSVNWWNTLHQGATLSAFAKPKIALPMLYPLLVMISAFVSYFILLLLQRMQTEVLYHEKKTRWVSQLINRL